MYAGYVGVSASAVTVRLICTCDLRCVALGLTYAKVERVEDSYYYLPTTRDDY